MKNITIILLFICSLSFGQKKYLEYDTYDGAENKIKSIDFICGFPDTILGTETFCIPLTSAGKNYVLYSPELLIKMDMAHLVDTVYSKEEGERAKEVIGLTEFPNLDTTKMYLIVGKDADYINLILNKRDYYNYAMDSNVTVYPYANKYSLIYANIIYNEPPYGNMIDTLKEYLGKDCIRLNK